MEYNQHNSEYRTPNIPDQEQPQPGETDLSDVASQQAKQGIREHGDAFRAFLRLPDIDPLSDELLTRFQEFYVGTYTSMDALFEALTELRACKAEVDATAARWGLDDMFVVDYDRLASIARAVWDIVEIDGTLYVFS